MKILIVFLLVLPLIANADVSAQKSNTSPPQVVCNFTEPFLNTIFDESKNVLYIYNLDSTENRLTEINVTANKNSIRTELYDSSGSLLLEIDRSKNGNDGMSDWVYDYEGVFHVGNEKLYGGCNLK